MEAHLVAELGLDTGRAGVTFLGTERYDVLRFGGSGDGPVRYVTLGMCREPTAGARSELVLSVRDPRDEVLRALAVLAATPAVEGLELGPGASISLDAPLWPGSRCPAVLVGEPGGVLTDADTAAGPVRFLPVLPMTAQEAAYKRVHGAAALQELWLAQQIDLRDPMRSGARLS